MSESNRTPQVQLKPAYRVFLPYLILLLGLCFTLVVYYYFSKLTFEQDQSRFHQNVDDLQDQIAVKLDTSIVLLRAGTGLFAASDDVNLSEFNRFVQRFQLEENYPGIQCVGFAAVFRPQEKDALVKRMRGEGETTFDVYPAGARDIYTAIVFLQPKAKGNERAIGYDMFTDPVRREAMERARDSGQPAAS